MEVIIDEVVSTVHAVDTESLVSPSVIKQLVDNVMRAVRSEREHDRRVHVEQRRNAGRVQDSQSDGYMDNWGAF